jgi:hypothetical protein
MPGYGLFDWACISHPNYSLTRRAGMDITEIALGISVTLLDKLEYDFEVTDDKEARIGHINTLAEIGAKLYKTTLKKLNEPG